MRLSKIISSNYGGMSVKSILSINVLVLTFILFFQNCTQPIDELSLNSEATVELKQFPYEVKIDYVAFLSCPKGAGNEAGWSFKVGAMGKNSGIGLSDKFKSANSTKTKGAMDRLLLSGAQSRTIAMLGLRAPTGNAADKLDNENFKNSFSTFLSNPEIRPNIAKLKNGEFLNYFENMKVLDPKVLKGHLEQHPYRFQTTLPAIPSSIGSSNGMIEVNNNFIKNSLKFTFNGSTLDGLDISPIAVKDPQTNSPYFRSLKPKLKNFGSGSISLDGFDMVNSTGSNPISVTNPNCRDFYVRKSSYSGARLVDTETGVVKLTRQILDPDNDEWWIAKTGSEGSVISKRKDLCGSAADNSTAASILTICITDELKAEKIPLTEAW